MIKITTKVGVLYMESENEREESDRIKLYDSYSRYLEYLPLESVSPYETIAQYCNKVIRRLEECDSVDEILKYLGISAYTTGRSWTHLLEYIYSFDGYDYDSEADMYYELPSEEEITRNTVLENEWVNIIGYTYVLRYDCKAVMAKKIRCFAKNKRPECNEMDCFTCNYFDYKEGYCSADKEIKDCSYCKNAFTDLQLDPENDLSYTSIGQSDKSYSAFICASAIYRPPVKIIVQKYQEDIERNIDIFYYTPAFCPVCGRKIIENAQYLKNACAGGKK